MTHYACHDRKPFKPKLMVQDGFFMDGYQRIAKMANVPFVMSMVCEFTKSELGRVDSKCEGCKWKDQHEA